MAGTPKAVKRAWSNHGTASTSQDAFRQLYVEHNNIIEDLDTLRRAANGVLRDGVVFATTGPGLSVDANAPDVETDNAVIIQVGGSQFAFAAAAAIDISALIGAASTITTSTSGALWVFGSVDGSTVDVDPDIRTSAYTSKIAALAAYANSTVTLPPAANMAPLGVVQVTEGGSGTFTWGTDSITAEDETYYSFNGPPCILTPAASFAYTTATPATFDYGAGVLRLGSTTVVSFTGKSGVTIAGTAIANKAVGAWLFYVLADDSEYATQIGAAYTSLEAAKAAVRALKLNPLMPEVGVIYVENNSGASWTPGTTSFALTGVTSTFEIRNGSKNNVDSAADLLAAKLSTAESQD